MTISGTLRHALEKRFGRIGGERGTAALCPSDGRVTRRLGLCCGELASIRRHLSCDRQTKGQL